MPAIAQTSVSQLTISYPLLPEDFPLPDDPVENTDQPLLASALRQPLPAFPNLMQDALVVSNSALCAAIEQRFICKASDWMYVRSVKPWQLPQPRRSYTPNTVKLLVMASLPTAIKVSSTCSVSCRSPIARSKIIQQFRCLLRLN